ncbi:MarR family transcriptional regulator [Latilactobacillus curvatus]|uniref:transcriptional regulator, SarA/Rot family n=1 Tax=Latilactobacillus curvatus TaxID=28038 RepID=UPI0012FD7DBA|nr:MarR family transcriptional regulator [Latilactobacillus curvatus]MDG2979329.1 MarR family transcriptional regulator [Latilactobacillus curvatus]
MRKNILAFYEAVQQLDNTRRALNDACEAYHISFEQFVLMKRIVVAGGIRPTQLSDDLHISRAAVSRKLTQLYQNNYLSKERSGIYEDQRVVIIELTSIGEKIVKEIDQFYNSKLEMFIDPVGGVLTTAKIFETLS